MKTNFHIQPVIPNAVTLRQAVCIIVLFILSAMAAKAQKAHCECSIPAFSAITLYHSAQAGSALGFGMEAGNWNKDASRFSYFLGTKMQWYNETDNSGKMGSGGNENTQFMLYLKGQFRLIDQLYVVVSPGIVNLNNFETGAGLRYTIPISRVIGIGVEPTYSIIQRRFSLNTNIHFALDN